MTAQALNKRKGSSKGKGKATEPKMSQAEFFQMKKDELKKKVADFVESGEWKEYLLFRSKFRQYSFLNTLLIYLQDPEATYVRTFHQWEEMGRKVKGDGSAKGKGIHLIRPYFKSFNKENPDTGNIDKVQYISGYGGFVVFDIRYTDGEAIPEILHHVTEGYSQDLWEKLVKVAGCPVEREDMAPGKGGYYSPMEDKIVLNSKNNESQQLKTLIHEISHRINKDDKSDSDTECVAEGTAFMVAAHFGIDTSSYSVGYLTSWSRGNVDQVERMGNRIIETASKIIEGMTGKGLKESKEGGE